MRPAAFALAVIFSTGLACSATQLVENAQMLRGALSEEQENSLASQIGQHLEERELRDPEVDAYVQAIATRIIEHGRKDRPGVEWRVRVIDDPRTVNAWALPGGYIYLNSGLLLAADDEAAVAGVLAHEAGHVVARHATRQLVSALGLRQVTSLALGKNPAEISKLAAMYARKGVLLANSRSDETEADEHGARYASAARYDPHGLADFFRRLQAEEGESPAILKMLSDHPATPERIDAIERYIAERHLGGVERNAEAHERIKQRLVQLGSRGSGQGTDLVSTSPRRR